MSDVELSDRERRVLAAIVESHLGSGDAVASKALAAELDLGVSPQTIRNVMSALTELGLIEKRHSSAGRIPTTSGLRFYVDSLLKLESPPDAVRGEIEQRIRDAQNVDGVVDEAGRVLARLARHACVVRAPKTDHSRLRHIDLVRLRDDVVLVILVTEEGLVQNRLVELSRLGGVHVPKAVKDERLTALAQALSHEVAGKTLDEARRILSEKLREARETQETLAAAIAKEALDAEPAAKSSPLRVEGERHLLLPGDPRAAARMSEVLQLIEEKTPLLAFLDEASHAPGIRVFLGRETGLDELEDLAVITAGYGSVDGIIGGLGVIGPMHMDFGRIVPLVGITAELLSSALARPLRPR